MKALYFTLALSLGACGHSSTGLASNESPELIVRFERSTQEDAALSTDLRSGEIEASVRQRLERSLSEAAGVPLRIVQLLSGPALLVQVDAPAVTSRVADELRDAPTLRVVADEGRPDAIVVVTTDAAPSLEAIVSTPLRVEALSDEKLALTVDWDRLLAQTAERLTSRSEIKYAEPNRVAQPKPSNAGPERPSPMAE